MKFLYTFEKFDKVAFHGYGMKPSDMHLTDCSVEWQNPSQDTGCPAFSDSKKITKEDEQKAIDYLTQEDINVLIAYSRGGALFIQALAKKAKPPKFVYLVAPAWKRGWATIPLNGSEISDVKGCIIHGGKDDKVPLKHSLILARSSGLPLYVFPNEDHITILKYKDDTTKGQLVENLDELLENLPDWGENNPTPEELKNQSMVVKKYLIK